jgi:hypothetical protein
VTVNAFCGRVPWIFTLDLQVYLCVASLSLPSSTLGDISSVLFGSSFLPSFLSFFVAFVTEVSLSSEFGI